jgi:hypothetical protein
MPGGDAMMDLALLILLLVVLTVAVVHIGSMPDGEGLATVLIAWVITAILIGMRIA